MDFCGAQELLAIEKLVNVSPENIPCNKAENIFRMLVAATTPAIIERRVIPFGVFVFSICVFR